MHNHYPRQNSIEIDTAQPALISLPKVLSIKDLLSANLPPREYIIEPIIPKQGIAMIVAKKGVGKTFFALHLSCSIAGGFDIFDGKWKVATPQKVLYIDGEMPANLMQERLNTLINGLPNILPDTGFHIINPDFQCQDYQFMPDISSLLGQSQIEAIVKDKNIDVIVIDNVSTLCHSGRENESESWVPINRWALKMRSLGKAIIFIHHAGKNDSQRGTSKKEDVLDTIIKLSQPKGYKASQGAKFKISYDKSRGFAGDAAEPFEVNLQVQEEKATWRISQLEESVEDPIVNEVKELSKAGLNHREIANKLGISESKAYRSLKKSKL